jgi:hypothetical protein
MYILRGCLCHFKNLVYLRKLLETGFKAVNLITNMARARWDNCYDFMDNTFCRIFPNVRRLR